MYDEILDVDCMGKDEVKIDKYCIKIFSLYSITLIASHEEVNELNSSEDGSRFSCGYLSEVTFNWV